MKTWLKKVAVILVAVMAGGAWAGESPWTLSLGASYREFEDVTFGTSEFRNWGQHNGAGPYGVQNISAAPGNYPNNVILDEVRYDGGEGGLSSSDKLAPIIGLRYDLHQTGRVRLAIVGNFQYFRVDVGSDASGSADAPGDFTVNQYTHSVLPDGTVLESDLPPDFPESGTFFSVRNQFEMDLYVLDLGLEARTELGCSLNLFAACGPTLTFADAESSQSQSMRWKDQGPGLVGDSHTQEDSDSSSEFLLGAYVALGVSFDLTESWSLALECRYDYVNGDAGTDQAEIDLSGYGAIVSLRYQF